jgi:hypothetical protein
MPDRIDADQPLSKQAQEALDGLGWCPIYEPEDVMAAVMDLAYVVRRMAQRIEELEQ